MLEPLEVYALVQCDGRWWLPYGPEADTETLSHVFSSDCSVVFLGSDGGSFAYDVTDEGDEVVTLSSCWRTTSQAGEVLASLGA